MSEPAKIVIYQGKTRLGLVESVVSLQWMPAWNEPGEFKLVCASTVKNRKNLTQRNTLYNQDTPELAAVITAVLDDTDKSNMTVRGKFSLVRFKQRVVKGTWNITDAAEGMLELCRTNLRGLPITVPEAAPFTAPCQETVEWTDCCSAITQLAKAGNFGVRVRFDRETGTETLELLQGVDRSSQNSEGYRGYFGTRMRNLSGVSYEKDGSDYANVVICGGETPSEQDSWQRLILEVGDTEATGADRHELWVDGSSVTHRYTTQAEDGSTQEAVYTEEEYGKALARYAAAALISHLDTETLKATAGNTRLKYGVDYNLGDRVLLKIQELGLDATAQVTSLKIIYEKTGRTLQPVFDNIEFGGDID